MIINPAAPLREGGRHWHTATHATSTYASVNRTAALIVGRCGVYLFVFPKLPKSNDPAEDRLED